MLCVRIRINGYADPNDMESEPLFATYKVAFADPGIPREFIGSDGQPKVSANLKNYHMEPPTIVGFEDEELGRQYMKGLPLILEEVTGVEPDHVIIWDPAKPRPSSKPDTDAEIVAAVFGLLVDTPDDDISFTKSGAPNVKWIESKLGYDIDSEHRDEAWKQVKEAE